MAEEVGKGVVAIEADTKGLGRDIANKVDGEKGTISKAFSGIGSLAGTAFKAAAVGVAAGAVAAIAFGKASIGAASDLSESMSKIDVVFGDNAQSVKDWSKTSAEAFGQSQQQALEAAGTYGNLFQAFGVGQQPAQEMSQTLVGLAADLASFNNTSVDDALNALRSGLSGETEPLKRFGVAINDARLKEEALRLGLIKSTKEALTPGAKAQAAYALIMKDTTLAQGDFARTSDGLANKQRILAAKFEDVKARVGKALLPAMLAIVSVLADKVIPFIGDLAEKVLPKLREAFQAVVEWVRANWPQIRDIVVDVFGRVRDAVMTAFEAIQQTISWLSEHHEVLGAIAAVVAGVLVAAIVAWTTATWAQVTALWAQAAAFVAAHAPIIAIIAVIAALVAGVIYAYEHWGWFRAAVDAVASFMKDTLWPILQNVFGWIRDNVPPIIQGAIDVLQRVWAWIQDYVIPVLEVLYGLIRDYVVIQFNVWREAVEKVVGWLQTAWDKSETLRALLADTFLAAVSGIKDAFNLTWEAVEKVANWLQTAWEKSDKLRSLFVGTFLGAIDGITGAFGVMKDIVGDVIGALDSAIEKVKWLIDKIPDIPKFGVSNPFDNDLELPPQGGHGARARGGPVEPGKPYVVGEDGWEFFVPDVSGRIIDHQTSMGLAAGGGTRTGVHIDRAVFESAADVDAVMRVANFELAAMGV